jgi:putative FmdB family regulatory protein
MRHHVAATLHQGSRTHAMPIYEFECPSCQHRFEKLQKVSDADPTDCPECGKQGVRRRLTAPAFRLSGSGWYETDFKKEGDVKRNLASADSATKSEPAAASPAKSEPAKAEPAKNEAKPNASSTAKDA